jgi:protein phosphatase
MMQGRTDTGRVRANNEDSFALAPEIGLAVLADGMGGHLAGEVASRLAVDTVMRQLPAHLATLPALQALLQAITEANGAVFAAAGRDPAYAGMGTTLVTALFTGQAATIAYVGDSRAYRLRGGRLERLTQDHTLAQEWIALGSLSPEAARVSPYRHMLTRAVGIEATVQPEWHEQATAPGDIYLLCSDGLTDMLTDATIERLLIEHQADLGTAAERLIEAANVAGGVDNVTVVLARMD